MTDAASAIQTDAHDTGFEDDDAAGVDAFLANLNAAEENRRRPSNGEQEATETEEDHRSEETEETQEEDQEEGAEKPEDDGKSAVELGDDVKVKVKVNGEDHEVTLGDLKRLAGQEKALTQKSMEVAEARRGYETQSQRASAALKAMLDRAEERYKPFAGLTQMDMVRMSQSMDDVAWNEFAGQVRSAASDVQFLKQELDGHMRAAAETQMADMRKAATDAIAVLSGPEDKGGIGGWSKDLYNDILAHAVSQGLPKEVAYTIVDPAAIRLMHKAMLFDRGQVAAKTQITRVKTAPTKVAKPGASGDSPAGKGSDAVSRLSKTGSDDDAVDAFLAGLRR